MTTRVIAIKEASKFKISEILVKKLMMIEKGYFNGYSYEAILTEYIKTDIALSFVTFIDKLYPL